MSFVPKLKNGFGKTVSKIRNSKLFKKKDKKKENPDGPSITDTDIAIAKLKSEKRNINELIRKARNESTTYLEKAKSLLKEGDKESAKQYYSLHQSKKERIVVLNKSLMRIEEQINLINDAQDTKTLVDVLRDSTTTLEGLRDSIGTKEEIMDLQERQRQLKEFLGELDCVVGEDGEDSEDDEGVMHEVDLMIDEDLKNEAKEDIDNRLVDTPFNLDMTPDSVTTKKDDAMVAEE